MLRSLLLAVSFLTILPLYYKKEVDNQEFANSVSYYTLVGLALGIISAGICYGLHKIGLTLAGDMLSLVILLVLTGGLHMDGLMDTADGIFSGRSQERKLEIMKDSRVGAMGVMAFGVVFLTKIGLLFELGQSLKYAALVLSPVAGRWAMVYAITSYPYARSEGGLGASVASAGKIHLAIASFTFILAFGLILGFKGIVIITAVIVGALLVTRYISRCIGGMTGDTYGATGELIEVWTLMVILLAQQSKIL